MVTVLSSHYDDSSSIPGKKALESHEFLPANIRKSLDLNIYKKNKFDGTERNMGGGEGTNFVI